MSKRAEEMALKAYPKEEGKVWSSAFGIFEFDKTAPERTAYQKGYEQAGKETIERVLDYLYENLHMRQDEKEEWLDEFRRAMEEE